MKTYRSNCEIKPETVLHCFIRRRSYPRVEFFALAFHRFQFGFASVAFPFNSTSYLQLFDVFFIHSTTVRSCLQAYVLSSQKNIIFVFEKRKLEVKTAVE